MKNRIFVGFVMGLSLICILTATTQATSLTYEIEGQGRNDGMYEIYSGFLEIDLSTQYMSYEPNEMYSDDSNHWYNGTYVFNISNDYGDGDPGNDIMFTFSGNARLSFQMMFDTGLEFDAFSQPMYSQEGEVWDSNENFVNWHTPDFDLTAITSLHFDHWGILAPPYTMAIAGDINLTQVIPVPEPATFFLIGTGLAGFVGMRIRRKKNNSFG